MKKVIKYILWLVIVVVLAFNSVYFKKLSEVKAATNPNFNAQAYAQNFWKTKLPSATAKAIDVDQLINQLKASPDKAFETHGHALAIGTTRFFMVKGAGTVTAVDKDEVKLLTGGAENNLTIATEYVYGNAVRDASAQVNINDFSNTLDLNNVSAELNRIIRKQVLPPFKSKVKKGDVVSFTGATQLNSAHLNTNDIEIMPISLNL